MNGPRILVVRLGAMGDIIAALPAVASLKHSIPHSKITWAVESKWSPLLEGESVRGFGAAVRPADADRHPKSLARAARRTVRLWRGLSRA